MTTQPKRLTAAEEANAIVESRSYPHCDVNCYICRVSKAVAAALRQRDELYAKAWEECKEARLFRAKLDTFALRLKPSEDEHKVLSRMAKGAHAAARKAAGLED